MIRMELTRIQQSALTMILVDFMRRPESTREWIDIVNDETVTIDDLLTIVTQAAEAYLLPPPQATEEYFRHAILPQMSDSKVVIAILDNIDSLICLQIGAALLLDKPLLVLATSAASISERLRRIADRITVIGDKGTWKSDEARARIQRAIDEIMQTIAANREGISGFDERKDFQK